MKIILSLYCLLLSLCSLAQPGRVSMNINDDWEFTKDKPGDATTKWQKINLPHTWNIDDVMDDEPGYYRGTCWYRRQISFDNTLQGKEIYLHFDGANQQTIVFINGKKAGEHTGGYTGFYIPVSAYIDRSRENEILVAVNNSYDPNVPPLSADFTFYGGIYRTVSLIALTPVHFSIDNYGSRSVYVSTPEVSDRKGVVKVKGTVSNNEKTEKKINIVSIVYNKKGKKIAEARSAMSIGVGKEMAFAQTFDPLKDPHLWSPGDPYLYSVVTKIVDEETGTVLEEQVNPLGFRWFDFDAENGFFLNGKSLKLVGTSRHQDYPGIGNAVTEKLAVRDVELIKEMGGNFLRVAHYPQDPCILETCDRLGILASVEIPIVNEISESDSFYRNCEFMQVEMIRQNYNHPSVIIWCYMNDVLLKPHFNNDKERQKIYFENITQLAKNLDSITRNEDPSRFTMMAHHGDFNKYRSVGLVDIPMIVGWNLYSGWYGPDLKDFPKFLDQFHKAYPGKPMMVTEYGADADPRIRSDRPVRFDKSVEYATLYHRYYLQEMNKRPFVAGAVVWNLADFNSETRTETMPHINNKGLLEWNRDAKDPYYYYKAMLQEKPFVRVLGSQLVTAEADSGANSRYKKLQVATNIAEIGIVVNGNSLAVKRTDNGFCEWQIPLINGFNSIEVSGESGGKMYKDHALIECRLQPYELADSNNSFQDINILLGADRYFIDKNNNAWMPCHEYRKGSWGYIGGRPFRLNNNRLPYGTDKNIRSTEYDPVYQTQQMGIQRFRLDLPDGVYELTLHFAELLGGTVHSIPYDLDPSDRIEPAGKRIFDVYVNDSVIFKGLNIAEQFGVATAMSRTLTIRIKNNTGIEIRFVSIEGDPILNALQVKRLDAIKNNETTLFK